MKGRNLKLSGFFQTERNGPSGTRPSRSQALSAQDLREDEVFAAKELADVGSRSIRVPDEWDNCSLTVGRLRTSHVHFRTHFLSLWKYKSNVL